jgi:pimeloyl-ACP methyl ester carboxylesterase
MLCAVLTGGAAAPADIVGDWAGALEIGAVRLHLVLHVSRGDGGALRATMDSLDQGANGIPVDVIVLEGTSLHFEMNALGASYDGTLSEDGNELAGDFTQRGTRLPLRLTRTDDVSALSPKRPQEPKPPFPYASEDVTYSNPAAGVTLAGTLTLPTGAGPHAVVVLISGSGPQDRDEFLMGHRPFLVLADHLTRKGIAVLRVDDRGVGKSTGTFATSTTEDFASDVLAGVAYLKTRREIDPKRIGLIGHSEGGYVAPLVATRSPEVAFIVLLAGPGVPIAELLREQARLLLEASGADPAFIEMNQRTQERMFEIVRRESDPAAAEPELKAEIDALLAQLPPAQRDAARASAESSVTLVNSPWFRYLLTYDPARTLHRVKVPVLALNGELDLQVPPAQNLPAIEKALKLGGNQDVETAVLPKLNHLFQTATTGSVSEYRTIEETMSSVALDKISNWILARTKLSKKK